MIPPESVQLYYLWWSLSFLRDVFVIDPSISLAIISDCTLQWNFFISVSLPPANFVRSDNVKGFGRTWFTLPIICSPKYLRALFYISSIITCSTTLKMFSAHAPVFTMNVRRPRTYLLAKLRKWSMMSLVFET